MSNKEIAGKGIATPSLKKLNLDQDQILKDDFSGKLFGVTLSSITKLMVGIPLTGLVRAEFMIAKYGQVMPCNWSMTDALQWVDHWSPLNFQIADARNVIAQQMIELGFEWLFFIDHDVILPSTCLLKLNEYMRDPKIPMLSGLYFTKSKPSEPLIYRGRGNSFYPNWKMGDKVWVDGIPSGCTLYHRSIIEAIWKESEEYIVKNYKARKIWETPHYSYFDPEQRSWHRATGTEDLKLCDRIMQTGIFKKAGWSEFQKKKYPFMVDTSIFCKHIDWDGVQYPAMGEEKQYIKDK